MISGDSTNPYVSPNAAGEADPASADTPRDRSLGLALFGTLQLLIGGFFALMVPFFVLLLMPQPAQPQPHPQVVVPFLISYATLAAAFATLGVGSILARRWARALTLVLSWLWLVTGLLAMALVLLLMGGMFVMPAVTIGVIGCIYLVLPAALILFYRSPHVKATCERRDPTVRWTDRCPLPVLGLSVVLGLTALGLLGTPLYGGAVPAFGTVLRGIPGTLACLGILVATAWLARATYKLRPGAWWGCVALVVALSSSTVVTLFRLEVWAYYETKRLPADELDMVRRTPLVETMPLAAMSAVTTVAMLGYLLWVRRHFSAARTHDIESEP